MNQISLPQRSSFASCLNGKDVDLYHLTNGKGIDAYITNYGARIVALIVPDKDGNRTDVVLGHDSLQEYIDSEEQYFGAVCGRYANRIARGSFSIDGRCYSLPINNGPNSLHGGISGFNTKVWEVKSAGPSSLVLEYVSADGEEGYPGELVVRIIYSVTDEGALHIDYRATADAPTVLNLTNHSYFNLSGAGDPSVHDHTLMIQARHYLPTDDTAIPYGEPTEVEGTPFDFLTPHGIGDRIDSAMDQLIWAKGYDHTFIVDKPSGAYGFCSRCVSPKTGIVLDVYSTEPGMQVYTGNWMSGKLRGKSDRRYPARSAVCFETQHYPDSPNKPNYPTTLLRPGEVFESRTAFRFGIVE
mgnify:FL=1